MATYISKNPEATVALGVMWGREAPAGWILGLTGDLGAGKTQLVKGLARGLGITEPVRSPTFALVHEYRGGRLPLVHLDFYRLDDAAQILAAGLETYLQSTAGVTVVEWCERWPEFQAPASGNAPAFAFRLARFEQTSERERRIHYADFGS